MTAPPCHGRRAMPRTIYLLPLWGLALWGALALRDLPGDWGHALCGPWGCGPPLQALLSIHAAWAVLLWAPAFVLPRMYASRPARMRRIGTIVAAAGVGGLIAIAIRESLFAGSSVSESAANYLLQRILFVIATSIDAPVVQATIAGLVLRWGASSRQRAPVHPSAELPLADARDVAG